MNNSASRRKFQAGASLWVWILAIGCGGLILLCIVSFLALRPMIERSAKTFEQIIECGEQLEAIGAALQSFRAQHQGHFPLSLEQLVPTYLSDRKAFKCPIDPRQGQVISYSYIVPTTALSLESPVLKCERHSLNEVKIVLVLQAGGKLVITDEHGKRLQ